MDAEKVKYLHEQFEFILSQVKQEGGWDQESSGKMAMHLQNFVLEEQIAHSLMRIDEHLRSIAGSLKGCGNDLFANRDIIKEGFSDVVDVLDKIRRYFKGI